MALKATQPVPGCDGAMQSGRYSSLWRLAQAGRAVSLCDLQAVEPDNAIPESRLSAREFHVAKRISQIAVRERAIASRPQSQTAGAGSAVPFVLQPAGDITSAVRPAAPSSAPPVRFPQNGDCSLGIDIKWELTQTAA